MILTDVIDEVAAQVDTIPDLRVFAYPADTAPVPVAIMGYPDEIEYDKTYGRGQDMIKLPLVVLTARSYDRVSLDLLSAFVSGSGPKSVRQVVESHDYTSCSYVSVESADLEIVKYNTVDAIASIFDLLAVGEG